MLRFLLVFALLAPSMLWASSTPDEVLDALHARASAADYDGLVVPGGFGAAKKLSDFAVAGPDMKVEGAWHALRAAVLLLSRSIPP